MNLTPQAEHLDALVSEEEGEQQPRFAKRMVAASVGRRLSERLLLHRARSEGEAHRRSESAEQAALDY